MIGFGRTVPNPEVDRARDGVASENLVFNITSSNFHLRAGSPARNGGENPGPQIVGDEDLDGRHRLEGAKIDIGCYEMSF